MKKETLIAKLEEEYDALKEKLSKLVKFLNKEYVEEEVGENQLALLITQENAMQIYLNTLAMRIDDLTAELEDDTPDDEEEENDKEEDKTPAFIKDLAEVLDKYIDKK